MEAILYKENKKLEESKKSPNYVFPTSQNYDMYIS